MNESIAPAKDAVPKKSSSSIYESDEGIHNDRNETDMAGDFGAVMDSMRSHCGTLSVDRIASKLCRMHTAEQATVLLTLQQTHGNRYVQRLVDEALRRTSPNVQYQNSGENSERGTGDAPKSIAQDHRFSFSLDGTTVIAREVQDAGVSNRSEQIECIRRLGGCPQTRPGGFPTEEEIIAYNEECRSETGYSGPRLQEEELLCGRQEEIATVPANTQGVPIPMHVAGREQPDQPYKIIRIAWTLDDGPTEFTGSMRQSIGQRGGTWFIQRNQLGAGDELQRRIENLLNLQNQQHQEIAIHWMHSTVNHGAWFPVNVSIHVPKVYDTIEQAMQDLTGFVGLLRGAGLTIHFVRLPGGLISEINAYLGSVGVETARRDSIAEQIIRGEDISGSTPAAQPVQRDYQTMQYTLSQLGLYLWGGGSGSQITQKQSWEAESSGSGLTDDVTARFNRLADEFSNVHRPRSMIVLAHDNNRVNAEEVARDIRSMETYAENHGVRVEYYSLSGLFRVVRGVEP